jgi:hypothetical protein
LTRTNSLLTIPLMSKKTMSMLLTLLFTCFSFFGLVSLDFPCTAHAFFPERLSNHCQGLCRTFSEICRNFYAVPLSDPSRNRTRPDTGLQIKERRKSARPPSSVKFCTLTPMIRWYYHLPLHHATTTAVQRTASIPQIIDTPHIGAL